MGVVHLKDYASGGGRDDVPVGEGVVGYDRLLPAALAAGPSWHVLMDGGFAYACILCCEVPWPRMALMRSTSFRGLNGLVM